jgi:hypothetical protein
MTTRIVCAESFMAETRKFNNCRIRGDVTYSVNQIQARLKSDSFSGGMKVNIEQRQCRHCGI